MPDDHTYSRWRPIFEGGGHPQTMTASHQNLTVVEPAKACVREENLGDMHVERRALTAEILQGFGQRTRGTWHDAAGPTQNLPQHRLRPSFSSSAGMTTGCNFQQGCLPLDHARALRHGSGDGRSLGWGAALPRPFAAGEVQPQPSILPSNYQQRRPSPWQTVDLTTVTNEAVIAVPVDRTPSEDHVMILVPSSSLALDGEVIASLSPPASWYEDVDGAVEADAGAGADGFETVPEYRDHRKVGRPQYHWASYRRGGGSTGALPYAPWEEGSKARDSDRSLLGGGGSGKGGEGGDRGAARVAGGKPSADERFYHQRSSASAPAATDKRTGALAGGGGGGIAGFVEFPAPGPTDARGGYPHGAPSWASEPPPLGDSGGGGELYRDTVTLPLLSTLGSGYGYGRAATSPPTPERKGVATDAALPPVGREPHWRPHARSASSSSFSSSFSSSSSSAFASAFASRAEATVAMTPRSWDLGPAGRSDGGAGARNSQAGGGLVAVGLGGSRWRGVGMGVGTGSGDRGGGGCSVEEYEDSAGWSSPGLAEAVVAGGGDQTGAPVDPKGFPYCETGLDSGGGATAAAAAAAAAGGRGKQRRRGASTSKPAKSSKAKGCADGGCDRRPIYAYKDKKPIYCARHRLFGMIDTRHPMCTNELCTRQPSFGMEGDKRASYCAGHRKEGMINVSSRRCRRAGCLRHPNFGFPGDRRASYCSGHRETGMMDIVSRRCEDPSCMRRPLYNFGGLRPVSCSQHKLPGMIDVVSTRCQQPGCLSHPSFGYAHDMKARRCAKHRLENMEGVKGHHKKKRRHDPPTGTSATGAAPAAAAAPSTSPPSPLLPSDPTLAGSGDDLGPDLAGARGDATTSPSARAGGETPRSSSLSSTAGKDDGGRVGAGGGGAAVGVSVPVAGGAGGGRGRAGGIFDVGGGPVPAAASSQK
eukprot:g18433.t1